jgi:hypothetical protein
MDELIKRLMAEGLNEQQAKKAVEVVKNFAKEQFPVFGDAIDKVFDNFGKQEEDFMP